VEETHRIVEVEARDNFFLYCNFENNTRKIYDLKPLLEKIKYFAKLKENKELYYKVKVDTGGYGISWDNEIDLATEELWKNGKEI